MSIEVETRFINDRYRGFRVPNQYTASDPDELASLRSSERITVHNARLLDPAPTLGTHGFQLVDAPCALDLLDTSVVESDYYEQCRTLLCEVCGCDEVRGGSHEYRNGFGGVTGSRAATPTPNGSGGSYAMGIHADMSPAVEKGFARIVPDERHFESINIWRSAKLGEAIHIMPLALCDMRSVDPSDIVFGDGMNTGNIKQYRKVVDEQIIFSPEQRWYYFPGMTADEVLLFRQYDTREEALNLRTVFHTAIDDPDSAADAPLRYTIETRMQAIYGFETEKAARLARFRAEISTQYADGRTTDWWSGPIESYVAPS